MLQVGLFSSRDNAEKADKSLKNVGLKPIIVR
jgi:cell division protein FtsN